MRDSQFNPELRNIIVFFCKRYYKKKFVIINEAYRLGGDIFQFK